MIKRSARTRLRFVWALLGTIASVAAGYFILFPSGNCLVRHVEIVELGGSWTIDRNFDVYLCDHGKRKRIFHSPDEGRPAGSEKFFWSNDGRWLLLAGKHFFLDADVKVPGGESCYLLYDTASGELRCNASQVQAKRFSIEDVDRIGFNLTDNFDNNPFRKN